MPPLSNRLIAIKKEGVCLANILRGLSPDSYLLTCANGQKVFYAAIAAMLLIT